MTLLLAPRSSLLADIMDITNELYRETILDHYKSPRHHGKLEKPDLLEYSKNPLCGDELELYVFFKDGKISDIAFQGKGCSISQASASIMTEAVFHQDAEQAQKIASEFRGMMVEGKSAESLPEILEDSKALEGVKKYPVRIKCAMLSWNTLLEALKKYGKRKAA